MKPAHFVLAIALMIVWGVALAIGKLGVNQMPPIFFTGLRACIVAMLLLPFLRSPRGHVLNLLLLSVMMGTLHHSLVWTGLKSIDASLAILLVLMQVPFASLLAVPFFGERIGWRRMTGLVIAFAGIMLIVGTPEVQAEFLPVLFVLTGIFFWAASNIQIKRQGLLDANMINGWVAIFSAPQIFAISFFLETGQIEAVQAADWQAWAALFYIAGVVTVISFILWYRLLRLYPINQIMPFTLLMPIFGVAAGVLMLGETLDWQTIVGGLITLGGVAIIVFRRPPVIEAGV